MKTRCHMLRWVACWLFVGANAWGAPPSWSSSGAPAEDRTEEARALYNAGREAYLQGGYAWAYEEFRAAWELKKHWQIAGNLGDAEMRLGMYRDAAEHLTIAVRAGAVDPATRGFAAVDLARMSEGLEQVKAQVVELEFVVKPDGAEVVVDGALVGTAPLFDPVFVEPGAHDVETRAPCCATVFQSIEAVRGTTRRFVINLEPGASARGALPLPAAPDLPADVSSRLRPAASASAARTALLAAEGGLFVTAAVLGTIFSMRAVSASDRVSAATRRTIDETGPNGCSNPNNMAPVCSDLLLAVHDQSFATRNATIAWAGAGALGVAVVGTLLLWPSKPSSSAALDLRPQLEPQRAGLELYGSF